MNSKSMGTTESPHADRFPRELLDQLWDERLACFEDKIVMHTRLQRVHTQVMHAIHHPSGSSIILVYGPTGAGKTTLCTGIEKMLIEEAGPEMKERPDLIPVVRVDAVAPESGSFSWADFYERLLLALGEPMIPDKIDYRTREVARDSSGRLKPRRNRARTEDLRWAVEQCLKRRGPVVLVDEAQHLRKMAGVKQYLQQMDVIKSLSTNSETLWLLVGTYELLDLTDLSAQLSRRSVDIDFSRYRYDVERDLKAFKSVLLTFQRHLPLPVEPNLVKRYRYFYENCLGCIGVLKSWLNRALAAALEHGEETLTDDLLAEHALPERKLVSMVREISDGERRLTATAEQRREIRSLLGLDASSSQRDRAETQQETPKPQPKPRRPGTRKPVRDPVGTEVNAS